MFVSRFRERRKWALERLPQRAQVLEQLLQVLPAAAGSLDSELLPQ
jgi:hypothetical protein